MKRDCRGVTTNYYHGFDWQLAIVQQDAEAVGHYRDFKWSRSNENIPSTDEIWANRWLNTVTFQEACGYFRTNVYDSRFHDDDCSLERRFICEC